jgi:hypothetical protein
VGSINIIFAIDPSRSDYFERRLPLLHLSNLNLTEQKINK